MKHNKIACRLQELGHNARLNIYRLLIKAGPSGMPVGSIQKKLRIPASTLSHHLTRLRNVGLITQKRSGSTLYCMPQISALTEVIDYLQAECCSDSDDNC